MYASFKVSDEQIPFCVADFDPFTVSQKFIFSGTIQAWDIIFSSLWLTKKTLIYDFLPLRQARMIWANLCSFQIK